MMGNLDLYNRVREVPKAAQKEIRGGRLNGKTDINPMWRIHKLTEEFGPVGAGWYTQIKRFWTEEGAKGERSAFCEIELYVKIGGEWSKPIAGIGGSAFVAAERSGLYTSDECYKMAYTDAISVACKALGFGADIYWSDGSKYDRAASTPAADKAPAPPLCAGCGNTIESIYREGRMISPADVAQASIKKYGRALCKGCRAHAKEEAAGDEDTLSAGETVA